MNNKYIGILQTSFRESMVYRLDALMSLGTSILFLTLYYFVWLAIDQSGDIQGGFQQAITYIVAGQIVANTAFVDTERHIGERVRHGTIVNELKRPIDFMKQIYFYDAGGALFGFFTKSLPVAAVGIVFIGIDTPSLYNTAFFLISLFLAFNVVFLFAYITSMLIFWTKIDWSIRMMRSTAQNLFSGALFPLYLLPGTLHTVFNLLPFQVMIDAPVQIFTMAATGAEIYTILGRQLFWILLLYLAAFFAWKKAKTKITVQGG